MTNARAGGVRLTGRAHHFTKWFSNDAKPRRERVATEPYLFFDGRCEEALTFYRQALGAEVKAMMRYSEIPDGTPAPPGNEDKIMHSLFSVGGSNVMASDGNCAGKPSFQGFGLALSAPDEATAERWFNALADGGAVSQPLIKTFFSPKFGMVSDRFGVLWMIMVQ
jgi:PhnB protein